MNHFSLKQDPSLATQQGQHLLLSMSMQQALYVLQMPVLELSEWLKQEIEQNPILELDLTVNEIHESLSNLIDAEHLDDSVMQSGDPITSEWDKKKKAYQESLLTYPIPLHAHLLQQARFTFQNKLELDIATEIIAHLDTKGFFNTPFTEITSHFDPKIAHQVLQILQTFDPPGICTQNLQDSLLIQLTQAKKNKTTAYHLIQDHFEALLSNKIPQIAKLLHLSPHDIQAIILNDIAPLNLYPGYAFQRSYTCPIIPDIYLEQHDDRWNIHINHSVLPHFHIAACYQHSHFEKETQQYIQRHMTSGQWLKKIVSRRKEILLSIANYLIKKQTHFLNGEHKTLVPMNIQEIAEELGLHESTIARGIANKYLACPQGTFSIRSFFTQGILCHNGQKVSNHTLRQLLCRMVDQEDKSHPLSDQQMVHQFQKMGLPCARRTIAKYRKKLHISPASKRRRWLRKRSNAVNKSF